MRSIEAEQAIAADTRSRGQRNHDTLNAGSECGTAMRDHSRHQIL
jgi:hypothetical protein